MDSDYRARREEEKIKELEEARQKLQEEAERLKRLRAAEEALDEERRKLKELKNNGIFSFFGR